MRLTISKNLPPGATAALAGSLLEAWAIDLSAEQEWNRNIAWHIEQLDEGRKANPGRFTAVAGLSIGKHRG